MKLNELMDELAELDGEEKLEWIIEFADQLPEVDFNQDLQRLGESCLVKECQTPVYLLVEVIDGRVSIRATVPQKSPIVRGVVAMLVVGLNGELVSDVKSVSDDLVRDCQLGGVLGMTRQQGMRGVIAKIKSALVGKS